MPLVHSLTFLFFFKIVILLFDKKNCNLIFCKRVRQNLLCKRMDVLVIIVSSKLVGELGKSLLDTCT